MEIHYQLLITHSVGFLITLWILKKFAWGPILGLIDERRDKIAGEFENIENEKLKAADLTAEYESKLKGIDEERRTQLVDAVNEGKKIAEEIKSAAHEETKKASAKASEELGREVAKAKVQLKEDIISLTIAAAEKIIRERLDDAKHHEMIGAFIEDMKKA